jgi:hypothetical protein
VLSDAQRARAAQRGDAVSLGILLERHRAPLYALALRFLGHWPQQAQDVVQDVFLIALSSIDRLREPEAMGGEAAHQDAELRTGQRLTASQNSLLRMIASETSGRLHRRALVLSAATPSLRRGGKKLVFLPSIAG